MPAPKDLIHETSTTTGTGSLTVSAVNGKVRFSDSTYGFGTGGSDVFDYFVMNRSAAEWEYGTGSMSDANTLVRDTVIRSSNSDSAVSFSAGTKDVTNDIPAADQYVLGVHTVGAAAGTLYPATTNGCAPLAQAETSTHKINYKHLAFDPSSVEYGWFWFPSPKSYNASSVTFRIAWTHPSTTTNFGVVWQLEILALANDDPIDTALGSAVTVTDNGGTTQDFYTTSVSGAVTPGNTASKQDWLACRIGRLATNGSDTMAVDAHLIGVEVFYTIDAPTDD